MFGAVFRSRTRQEFVDGVSRDRVSGRAFPVASCFTASGSPLPLKVRRNRQTVGDFRYETWIAESLGDFRYET
ncbi:hypothetical protein K227x_09340 [Rubripirellula lacrimiformis]|uniref:Uncharacterized protein n=1 Tax=Rubripirellula lacrimiformis TaxID=1930273 RepID=A0A517N5Z0_9BACT|nr:hypothetical protein K227x_09340 [Rubripirellula lacrimiformis]